MASNKFLIQFSMAVGDAVVLSALVRDIKLQHPDIQIGVRNNFDAIWRHNPYLTSLSSRDKSVRVLNWRGNRKAYLPEKPAGVHFIGAFHELFTRQTKIKVDVLHPHGDLHLSPEERTKPLISGRYVVCVPGGKSDMTTKIFSQSRYQEVVNRLREKGFAFVQEGAIKGDCYHVPLEGVLSVIGQTSVRDLIVNIQHCDLVICGITSMMHIAAALKRPCVVLAGGRETPRWEHYSDEWKAFGPRCQPVEVPHRYLHVMGQLPCCATKGCWKQRTVPLNDGQKHDRSLCLMPTADQGTGQPVPKCLDMISADSICNSVLSYYREGYLPPLKMSAENRNAWRKERGWL